MVARRISRAERLLWREFFCRSLPHGLVNWRYLHPNPPQLVKLHRQLWWASLPGLPRPFWITLEICLWLRWQLFAGWRSCWRVLRHRGLRVAEEEGLSVLLQARRVIPLSLGWCIPASEVYRLGLYRQPGRFLEYVYGHETPAYHPWRGGTTARESRAVLQDKVRQTRLLLARDIPMAPILAEVPRHSRVDLDGYLPPDGAVFCKSRSGSRGQGAFAAWRDGQGLKGWAFNDQLLSDDQVRNRWRRLLVQDDVLVQPRLRTHPLLLPVAEGEDVATVRFISVWRVPRPVCLCATLELPFGRHEQGRNRYVVLPIQASGICSAFPEQYLSTDARAAHARVHAQLGDQRVPDWSLIVDGSFRAHRQFPDVWAIAWDWAIASDGVCLLEGNAGWGATLPQLLGGPLLAERREPWAGQDGAS